MTTKDTLGVAVIGTGRMGADHVRRLDTVISGARPVAVFDAFPGRTEEVAAGVDGCTAYTDFSAALSAPDVDAVLLATPGKAHKEQLLSILERDLPVLCEKPLTPDSDSALEVLKAEQELGRRRITVGFMRRYDAEYMRLKALLDHHELGRPLVMHCQHRNPQPPPDFTEQMLINDSVVHEIDTTRWLLGQEITSVRVLRPAPSAAASGRMRDPQIVLFETSRQAIVDVEIFVHCGFGYQVRCEAVCERGTARVGDGGGIYLQGEGRWGGEITPSFIERFGAAYDREVQQWVDVTRAGRTEGASAWDGYATAAVCEAGVRAQDADGDRISVELIERPTLYRED
jgi:myo-inositol 2-dehydrogenase/D-chiro-inositol 1-dehydrogenase